MKKNNENYSKSNKICNRFLSLKEQEIANSQQLWWGDFGEFLEFLEFLN